MAVDPGKTRERKIPESTSRQPVRFVNRVPPARQRAAPLFAPRKEKPAQRPAKRSRENTGGRQRLTPAMQAGVVSELWDMERLYDAVME